jgi:hypothetical protein
MPDSQSTIDASTPPAILERDREIFQVPVPRLAKYTVWSMVGFVLLLGFVFAIPAIHITMQHKIERLTKEGHTSPAIVSGKHVSRGKSNTYYIHLAFLTENDDHAETRVTVSSTEYDEIQIGDRWNELVTYVPSDPSINVVGPIDGIRSDEYFYLVLVLIGVAVALFIGYQSRRQLLLLTNGELAEGRILEIGKSGKNWKLRYEFDSPSGRIEKKYTINRVKVQRAAEKGELQVGTPLTIVYDPMNTKWNVPYALMTRAKLTGLS